MRYKISTVSAILIFLGAAIVSAQAPQRLILEFVDGDNLDVVYPDTTSFSYKSGSIMEGDIIPVGSTLRTGAGTSVELRLKPNGTLIKLAKMTTFKVDGLSTPQKDQNSFSLVSGKLRTVAAVGSQYSFYTANTVAGVRGTDFSMAFEEGTKALLLVADGSVEFGRRGEGDAILDAIMVGAGEFADFFKGLTPAAFSPEQLAEAYEGLDIPPERMLLETDDEPPAETETSDTTETSPQTSLAADFNPSEAPLADEDDADKAKKSDAPGNAVFDWLREALGMEIGSITINGETWAKAVIQPTFTIGKLKTGLYLPIIYSNNLFDSSTWYKPSGNDEWSFGTDIGWTSENWMPALADAATDLALKIKFIEYGKPLVDPFFLKIGNLNSFTIGHGLLMRNYANDADFPSIRRIGLNFGLDSGGWGFEALTNDLTDNQILGARLYVRPIPGFKLAIGLSSAVDLYPATDIDVAVQPDKYGDPAFIGGAFDFDLPIVTSGLFGVRLFADVAAMAPYVRDPFIYEGSQGEAGFRYDMVWTGDSIQNWGAASGLIGNVLFIDWRLEYRYFTGAFRPAFFDSSYERRRSSLVKEWASYMSGAQAIDQSPSVMGIYGEGGASLMKDKLSLTLGYFWPWSADATSLDEQISSSDDYFKVALNIKKGLIPIVDLAGSVIYERRGFIGSIRNDKPVLFDENTTFSGEIVLPIPGAPNLDLGFIVSTVVARDANGDVEYMEADPTKVKIVPSITLETRLHF
ncbi:hypothetical protein MASR2M48_26330 [Spirochaetota bacterium]